MAKSQFPTEPKALARHLIEKAALSTGYASDLANGNRAPSLKLAVQIEQRTGIPCNFWVERVRAKAAAAQQAA